MKDIRVKAEEWNAGSTKKVPYEFVEFCEGKRSVDANKKYCTWEHCSHISLESVHTACGKDTAFASIRGLEKYNFCPYCGKKIKLKI
jgi:hypothetical protein